MAHYVNGVRMATTDAEIACMFERAKEVFKQSEREKTSDALHQKEQEFVRIILEGNYPDKTVHTIADGETFVFSITDICENQEKTAFQITGSVLLPEIYKTAALHIMAFTYNADGPLWVVGLSDTIFMEHVQGCVESNCMVRKVLLDAWHLGVMMTLAVVCDETVEAVSRIVLLNETQNHFFEGNKRQHG